MKRIAALALLIGASGTASGYCYQLINAQGDLTYSDTAPPYSLSWPGQGDPAREASRQRGESLIIIPTHSCPALESATAARAAEERDRRSLQHRAPTQDITRDTDQARPVQQRAQSTGPRLPRFDTESYCENVSQSVGGSYTILQGCITQEQQARQELAGMAIQARILSYCTNVAESVGGSYTILRGCITQETRARQNLQR
jgi:hypothetical protein